jgi:hypothetical protein
MCELAFSLVLGRSVRRYSENRCKAAGKQNPSKAENIACSESIVTPSWALIHNL